jgi:WD40 repeat protein
MRYFGMPIARSAPHIYISALPFTPSSSHVYKRYIHLFPQKLSLERGQLSHWPALEMEILAHSKQVDSVAFSQDGQRIASASQDCTICVWDAITGEIVVGPFIGHTDAVVSVAFSPDGRCIASASYDRTVRAPGSPGEFDGAERPVKASEGMSVGMMRVHAARFGPRTRGVRRRERGVET